MNAYHIMEIEALPDGGAVVRHETNDDNDDGYPDGRVVRWENRWKDLEAAKRSCGLSRVGISGIEVTVYLDGVRL